MFSQESKLAVLESKLNIYEELSREMLSKLEAAVEKISEGNNRIAMILTKHDERIEQSLKTDELLIKMIEGVKGENKEENQRVLKRIENQWTDEQRIAKSNFVIHNLSVESTKKQVDEILKKLKNQ